jgi:hypothetical protein
VERKAEAWMLRAERQLNANSAKNVRVHCDQEHNATHTVPALPLAPQARLGSARSAFATRSADFIVEPAAATVHDPPGRLYKRVKRRRGPSAEDRQRPSRAAGESTAGASVLAAPHDTDLQNADAPLEFGGVSHDKRGGEPTVVDVAGAEL